MADPLNVLYDKYMVLSAAVYDNKISEHSAEYLDCINSPKEDPKEKKLTAKIISQFYKHFPALQEQALNALLDFCEETDGDVRICAMKELPHLCKENKENVMNIASVLTQLLQLEDQDHLVACNLLIQVFKEDRLNAAKGILSNLGSEVEGLRDKVVNFVYKRLVYIGNGTNEDVPGLSDLFESVGKKILLDCTAEEFMTVMPYLVSLKIAKTSEGQKELINLVEQKIEINEKFDPLEEGTYNTDRLIMCVDTILPLFSAVNQSSKFLVYYCKEVLSQWHTIGTLDDGEQYQLRLLRQFALLSACSWKIENISEIVEQVFDKLKEYMPLPSEDVDVNKILNLNFTVVECLLYTFHKLAAQCPEFLTNEERIADFRLRLQYFARGVQGCKRGLKRTMQGKLGSIEDLSETDQEKVKIAPLVFANINLLIKDLFHKPPLYKSQVRLSFKDEVMTVPQIKPNIRKSPNRHTPITFDSSNGTSGKRPKSNKAGEDRQLYQPPSGKFSSNFGRSGSRGGTWNRGGGRGRGSRSSGRNWRN
ncbi:apoptosis inhibitor 5 isoform X1 [Euwallacea fornicatus]|uniref:apoptosis inhibitor 5 isoform X1 n=1 Tax=Euwallacea fornicatus TaxID=995702 RepID=UPI00338ED47C